MAALTHSVPHSDSRDGSEPLRPLHGLRVVEIGSSISGCFAARLLADLGAEVIKVEPVAGDPLRRMGPFPESAPEISVLFAYLNAGKRCIGLDCSNDTAYAPLKSLIDGSDLLICVPDPAVPLLGTLADATRVDRPATLVVTPFGLLGPRAGRAGSEFVAQHAGGFAYYQGSPVADPSLTPPTGCADHESEMVVGLVAANAALWAVLSEQSGTPKPFVDLSAEDVFAYFLVDALADCKEGRLPRGRKRLPGQGITIAGGLIWFLPCADGAVMVSPREDHQWARWAELIGSPEWTREKDLCGTRAARTTHAARLQALMSEWSVHQAARDVFQTAQAARVACFPVSTATDLVNNPQLLARGFFDGLAVGDGKQTIKLPGLPFTMTSSTGVTAPRTRNRSFPTLDRTSSTCAAAEPADA
jgi:crotonobetainyl-CoA:carnitine CoA-transferase CaiB-like acyl-CoA transferase